jgi:glyoxylase-like metal-dependent hydrolase (beta-lactamase superfamily II)
MITRRSTLLAGAAAGLVSALRPGFAAAPPITPKQAPAFYRMKVGDIELTAISDGYGVYPKIDGFVRNAPNDAVSAALAENFEPSDRVVIPFTTLVVNTGGKLVLLDTGNGDMAAPTSGTWMANFRAAGFTPEAVDMVVLSHFHGDHINGMRLKDGTAVFPQAEVKVPAKEAAFWLNDDNKARAAPGMMAGNFANVGRVLAPLAKDLTQYEWDKEVAPGVIAVGAPGHTPGHTMFAIASGATHFMAVSDLTNNTALFVRNPDWAVLFDTDPDMARATRHRVLDMVSAEKMHVGFYHAPFPANGFITRDGASRYNLVPATWSMPV